MNRIVIERQDLYALLEERFRLYKPHPDTIGFLEIRHQGTKYAELYGKAG